MFFTSISFDTNAETKTIFLKPMNVSDWDDQCRMEAGRLHTALFNIFQQFYTFDRQLLIRSYNVFQCSQHALKIIPRATGG